METKQRRPKISIVVPIYKVELYLKRCIDSILNQTFKDYELILVDDGSPDGCPDICDQYAIEDDRVIVIHKKNGGLSDARNAGLAIIKGEYVFFVDSDDLLAPNALEILLRCSEETNSEIVISTNYHIFSNNIGDVSFEEIGKKEVVSAQEAEKRIFCCNTRWEAWGTLYRAEIFEKEQFPVGMLYEDIALIPRLVLKAERVCFVESKIYYYFVRTGSIMDASKEKVSMDLFVICKRLVKLMENEIADTMLRNDIISGILMELCSRVELAEKNININKEFVKAGRGFLKKNGTYVMRSGAYRKKNKIYYFFVSVGLGRVWYLFHVLRRKVSKG